MYQLPACFPYIKASNEVDFNLFYSVLYQAFHKKYPKEEIQEKELKEILLQSHYANTDSSFHLIESVNCFELSKTYHCHFICQLCPYYPTYRNQKESEEKVLLSYMVKSYSNTKILLNLGLDHTLFTSLYFIQEEKPILFPLHTILFEYLQAKVKKETDFQQLPQQFIDDFSVLHQDKITEEATYQTIKNYILQLQNRPYDEQTLLYALKSYSEDFIKKFSLLNAKKIETEAKNVPIEKEEKIMSGLLLNEKRKEQKAPIKKMEQKEKRKEEKMTNSFHDKKEAPSCSVLAPTEFAFHQCKQIIWVEDQEPFFLNVLQRNFLLQPILPLELLTNLEDQMNYFLFYLKDSFYTISADSKLFLEWLKRYASISPFRTIISYSPYRLFHYFIKNKLPIKTIFPIYAAYELLPDSVVTKTPLAVLKQLISKESNTSPFFLFALPHYETVWKNLTKQLEKENDVGMKIKQKINKELFFSFSFELSDYTNQNGFLFTKDGNGFHFATLDSSNLNKNYIYHKFTFDYHKRNEKDEIGEWIEELIQIIADEFLYQNHFYLLSFHKDSLMLAINKESTVQICEKINTIATYLAEQKKNLPITITCHVEN